MALEVLDSLFYTLDELFAVHHELQVYLKYFLAVAGAIDIKLNF